jgi:hypothetical protein
MYASDDVSEQSRWILKNACSENTLQNISDFIKKNGKMLEVLPFGATRYSVAGISTVLDNDCMSQDVKETLRYLVIRENMRIYSRWDDKASLMF